MLQSSTGRRVPLFLRFLITRADIAPKIAGMGPKISDPPILDQDMPPPGGYPPVRIRRNNREKFWKPSTITVAMLVIMGYGWYKMYVAEKRRYYLALERDELQAAMVPFLQGERDIAYTVNRRAYMKKVAELMKDEPDFDINEKFYLNNRHFEYPVQGTYDLNKFRGLGLLEEEKRKTQQGKQN